MAEPVEEDVICDSIRNTYFKMKADPGRYSEDALHGIEDLFRAVEDAYRWKEAHPADPFSRYDGYSRYKGALENHCARTPRQVLLETARAVPVTKIIASPGTDPLRSPENHSPRQVRSSPATAPLPTTFATGFKKFEVTGITLTSDTAEVRGTFGSLADIQKVAGLLRGYLRDRGIGSGAELTFQ